MKREGEVEVRSCSPGFLSVVLAGAVALAGQVSAQSAQRVFYAHATEPDEVCVPAGGAALSCSALSTETTRSRGLTLGDFDGDGVTDLWLANSNELDRLCLGDGVGGFACSAVGSASFDFDVVASDFDEDGVLDTFVTGLGSSSVCLGDGAGGFACGLVGSGGHDAELADVSGDGRADVLIAGGSSDNLVCLSRGDGSFDCSVVPSFSLDDTWSVAVGDLDGTGNPDFVFGDTGHNAVCLDGTGCTVLGEPRANTTAVALGHLNADGSLDVVFANFGQPNRVCLGDGSGGLACSRVSNEGDGTQDVALADLDGDGRLDALFANETQANQVCLGDGIGGFRCFASGPPGLASRAVVVEAAPLPPAPIPVAGLPLALLAFLLGVLGLGVLAGRLR